MRRVHTTGLERVELERLRARVRRLFAILEEAAETLTAGAPGAWVPPVDVRESDAEVTVYVELPGVCADDVEVALSGTQLRVSGRKGNVAPRGEARHLLSERGYGEFSRVVPLRRPVKAKQASAVLKDGLLTVRLPKLADRRGNEIKLKVRSGDD